MPKVTDIPDGRGVLVKVLKVGVDATDKEINEAKYGNAPEGCNYLIIGHEVFGLVQEVGPSVKHVKPGDYVTLILPEFVPAHWWQQGLHNQTARILRRALYATRHDWAERYHIITGVRFFLNR